FGALMLILYGSEDIHVSQRKGMGNFLIFVNASFYGAYLILVRPLTEKYRTVTLLKWLFLMAIFINLPITLPSMLTIEWITLTVPVLLSVGFVILFTTFFTYLLNVYALNQLKAS